jgi:hypothetical protein
VNVAGNIKGLNIKIPVGIVLKNSLKEKGGYKCYGILMENLLGLKYSLGLKDQLDGVRKIDMKKDIIEHILLNG